MTDAKSDALEDDILKLLFQNVAEGIVSTLNISVGSATTLYATLATGAIGDTGDQLTNEISYTGFLGRQGLLRSSGNWPKSLNHEVDNGAALTFGQNTGTTSPTASHTSIGTAATSNGSVLYHGALDSSLVVNPNVNPQYAVGALAVQET